MTLFYLPGLLIPQYFFIPPEDIDLERNHPGRGQRVPSDVGSVDGVFIWGQSVYFIAQLLGMELEYTLNIYAIFIFIK